MIKTNSEGAATILACDYDETLASGGKVAQPVLAALRRFRSSGGKFMLVTGRELDDLAQVAPEFTAFDFIVAENGAVLFRPDSGGITTIARPPSPAFVAALKQRGVQPLSIGRSIVATLRQYDSAVREAITELKLDLEVILNRSSLMVLPRGVNKGTGLTRALTELCWLPQNVIGVGDAENDVPFLRLCGVSVAVANAIPAIQELAGWTTAEPRGDGVVEIIDRVLAGEFHAMRSAPSR